MLAQYSQDQRHATKPLDIPVPNIEIKQGTINCKVEHWDYTTEEQE